LKAPAAPSKRLIAKVPVESDHRELIRQGIFNERLVVFRLDTCLTGPYDAVPSSIQQQHDRIDHVLVGKES